MSAWLAALFLLFAPLSHGASDATSPHSPEIIELHRAEVLIKPYSDTIRLPAASLPDWRPIPLGERLENPSLQLRRIWFRMHFTAADAASRPWSVLFPRLYSGGSVYLNGVPIGEVVGSSPTAQAIWLSPHHFALPVASIRPGENTLLVAVTSRDPYTAIGPPLLGPQAEIERRFQQRAFWEATIPVITVWILFPVSIMLAALWYWRRQEVLYGIFALAAFAWGWRTLSFVWPVTALSIWIPWRAGYIAGTAFGIVLICIFSLRSIGFRRRGIERLALAYAATGPLYLFLLGRDLHGNEVLWYAGVACFNLFTIVTVTRLAWRKRRWSAMAVLIPPTFMFSAFIRYFAVRAGWLELVNLYWAHLVALVVVMTMCLMLLARFIHSLERVENINVELEQRVREREEKIRSNHEELLQMRLAQASALERQRIVQDMHDGLGSQLLSSLIMVERGAAGAPEIARLLRECIDDMRLVVDTLSAHDEDLLAALGTLRFRMEPRLAAAGIALDWKVICSAESFALEPTEELAVLRIVQEAITNVLKHAEGSQLSLTFEVDASRFSIRISDNGRGFPATPPATPSRGLGLSNMRRRAAAIRADLDVDSSADGTTIHLRKTFA